MDVATGTLNIELRRHRLVVTPFNSEAKEARFAQSHEELPPLPFPKTDARSIVTRMPGVHVLGAMIHTPPHDHRPDAEVIPPDLDANDGLAADAFAREKYFASAVDKPLFHLH